MPPRRPPSCKPTSHIAASYRNTRSNTLAVPLRCLHSFASSASDVVFRQGLARDSTAASCSISQENISVVPVGVHAMGVTSCVSFCGAAATYAPLSVFVKARQLRSAQKPRDVGRGTAVSPAEKKVGSAQLSGLSGSSSPNTDDAAGDCTRAARSGVVCPNCDCTLGMARSCSEVSSVLVASFLTRKTGLVGGNVCAACSGVDIASLRFVTTPVLFCVVGWVKMELESVLLHTSSAIALSPAAAMLGTGSFMSLSAADIASEAASCSGSVSVSHDSVVGSSQSSELWVRGG